MIARARPLLLLVSGLCLVGMAGCGLFEHRSCDAGGCCTSSRDCLGWQTCDDLGWCVTAPGCTRDAECLRGDVCSPNRWCSPPPVFDPEGMTVWGLLHAGSSDMGVAPLDQPTRVYGGVPSRAIVPGAAYTLNPRLRSDGTIVYVAFEPGPQRSTLREWVWDAWGHAGGFWYPPADDLDNDPIIPTPACMPQGDLVVRAGRGDLLYTCYPDSRDWYDTSGTLVVKDRVVHAWLESGDMLVSRPFDSEYAGSLFVRQRNGNEYLLYGFSGPPYALRSVGVRHVRSHRGSFRVLYESEYTHELELWRVSAAGHPTWEGAFEGAAAGGTIFEQRRIDGEGRLVMPGWVVDPVTGGLRSAIVRCPTGPASGCEPVYDASEDLLEGAPYQDRPALQIGLWTYPLLTGP